MDDQVARVTVLGESRSEGFRVRHDSTLGLITTDDRVGGGGRLALGDIGGSLLCASARLDGLSRVSGLRGLRGLDDLLLGRLDDLLLSRLHDLRLLNTGPLLTGLRLLISLRLLVAGLLISVLLVARLLVALNLRRVSGLSVRLLGMGLLAMSLLGIGLLRVGPRLGIATRGLVIARFSRSYIRNDSIHGNASLWL